jgi:hypothetical protein
MYDGALMNAGPRARRDWVETHTLCDLCISAVFFSRQRVERTVERGMNGRHLLARELRASSVVGTRMMPQFAERAHARDGRMTAVMRAVAPATTGPRALRVGVVRAGRIVEERLLTGRASATVGPSEKAMFVVEAALPPGYAMFERKRDGWSLAWLEGMSGRVATAAGVSDLQHSAHGARRITLDDHARGKVVVGDTTFLFQLVAAPAPHGRPQLPLSAKGASANRIDWSLTVLVALSFLLHFGFVGAMYSDWMDPIIGGDVTASLVMPPSTPVVQPTVETSDAPSTTAPTAENDHTPSTPAHKPSPSCVGCNQPHPNAPDPANVDTLLGELHQIGIKTIGVIGAGPHIAGVLNDPDVAPVDLEKYAQRSDGVTPGTDLNLPTTSDLPIKPGDSRLPSLVGDPTSPIATSVTTIKPVAPKPVVSDEGPVGTVPVRNAEAIIHKYLDPQVHRCYMRGLDENPSISGRIVLLIRIAPNGEVSSVSIESNAGITGRVPGCMTGAAQGLKFDAPGGVGSVLRVPFNLRTQPG